MGEGQRSLVTLTRPSSLVIGKTENEGVGTRSGGERHSQAIGQAQIDLQPDCGFTSVLCSAWPGGYFTSPQIFFRS